MSHKYKIGDEVIIMDHGEAKVGTIKKLTKTIYDISNQNYYVLSINNKEERYHEESLYLPDEVIFENKFKINDRIKINTGYHRRGKLGNVVDILYTPIPNKAFYRIEIDMNTDDPDFPKEYACLLESEITSIKSKMMNECLRAFSIEDIEMLLERKREM